MAQSCVSLGECILCKAKAYFQGGDKLLWKGETKVSASCSHQFVSINKPQPEMQMDPIPGKNTPKSFPSENEAIYHASLKHLLLKCNTFIDQYQNDLQILSDDFETSKKHMDGQYQKLVDLLNARHMALQKELESYKEEREKELENLENVVYQYREKCQQALDQLQNKIENEAEGQEREKECRKTALEAIQVLPQIFNLPYHLKFEANGMAAAEKQIRSYGKVQSTNLSLKTRILDFCYRENDLQWINNTSNPFPPSSSLSSSSLQMTKPPRVSIAAVSASVASASFSSSALTITTIAKNKTEPEEKVEDLKDEDDFSWNVQKLELDIEKESLQVTFALNPPNIQLLESYELELLLLDQSQTVRYSYDPISIMDCHDAVNASKGIFRLTVPTPKPPRVGVLHAKGLLRNQKDFNRTYSKDSNYLSLGEVFILPKKSVVAKISSSSFRTLSLSDTASALEPVAVSDSAAAKFSSISHFPENMEPITSKPILFSIEFNKEHKNIALSQDNLTVSHLRKQIAAAFGLDDPKALKLSSKTRDGIVLEKKLDNDAMIADFDTQELIVCAKLKKATQLKILLHLPSGITKYVLKDQNISFAAFKKAISQKVKISNDFMIEIANGENAKKIIENDQHLELLNFEEGIMDINIIEK